MRQQKYRQIRTQLPLIKSHEITPSNKDVSTNQSRSFFNHKKYMKPALSEDQVKEIKDIFDIFDPEGKGLINPKQLIDALKAVDYKGKQNTVYQQLMNLAADGEGQIQFEKFIRLMAVKVTQEDSRQDMNQLFQLFDDQKCGYITIKNLRRAIYEMQIDIDEKQLQRMIQVADEDKDGRVSEQQFYLFMTGKQ